MAWVPQDFVLINGILDSIFRNVNRSAPLLSISGGVAIDITSSDGVSKYKSSLGSNMSSGASGGIRPFAGSATLTNGSWAFTPASGQAAMSTNYGTAGRINMTVGVAGSGADVIVNSMTGASMTQITSFSLKAPTGTNGTRLSIAAQNKIADALVTSGANGFGVTAFTLKLYSGAMPSSLPATDTLGNSSAIPNFLGMFGKFENGGLSEVYFKAAVSGVSDASKSDASAISGLAPFYAATATGTATWGLLLDSAAGNVVLATTVGDTGTEGVLLNSASITSGGTSHRINSFNISL